MATALSDRPVRIKVFKNGDISYPSKFIVLNRRYFRTFDGLLEDCTHKLKLTTPARDICTPTRGTRVNGLETFQQDGNYVVCSTGPFKKLEYGDFKPLAHPPPGVQANEVKPVQHSRIQTSAKYKKIRNDVTKIFVYTNGNALEPAHPLTFTERELKNTEGVLSKITERVNLTSGAVRKLYDLEGQMITDLGQLDRNQFYVAVGAERLKRINYGSQRPLFSNSPRREKQNKPHDPFLPQKRRRPRRPGDSTTTATTDTSPTASTAPSNQTSSTQSRRNKHDKLRKEEDSVFHARPVKYKRSSEKQRRQADYDKDEGGVFKAKTGSSNATDAQEVEETKDTKVDLPVDQMDAQEVQDEDIEDEEKPRKERSPSPARDPTPPREPTPRRDRTMTPKPPSEPPQSRQSERRSLPPSRHSEKPQSRKSEKPAPEKEPSTLSEEQDKKPQSRQSEKPQSRQSEKPQSRQSEKPQSRQSEKPQSRQSEKPQSRQSEKPQSRESKRSNTSDKVEEKEEEVAEDDVKERNEAATKIQAGYRGYQVRKDVNGKKEQEPANQEEGNKSPDLEPANQDDGDKSDEVNATNQEEPDNPTNQSEDDQGHRADSANQERDDKKDGGRNSKASDGGKGEEKRPKTSEKRNDQK